MEGEVIQCCTCVDSYDFNGDCICEVLSYCTCLVVSLKWVRSQYAIKIWFFFSYHNIRRGYFPGNINTNQSSLLVSFKAAGIYLSLFHHHHLFIFLSQGISKSQPSKMPREPAPRLLASSSPSIPHIRPFCTFTCAHSTTPQYAHSTNTHPIPPQT